MLHLGSKGFSKRCPQEKGVLHPAGGAWIAVCPQCYSKNGRPRHSDSESGGPVHDDR